MTAERTKMKVYVVKSISNEGEYWLTRNWKTSKTFFTKDLTEKNYFKNEGLAKIKLLKLMDAMGEEYLDDTFIVMEYDTERDRFDIIQEIWFEEFFKNGKSIGLERIYGEKTWEAK